MLDLYRSKKEEVSHALHGVNSSSISAITPNVKQCFSNDTYDKDDFIVNSDSDTTLYLGMDCYDNDASWVCRIDKNVLCLTDEQINEIIEYDRKQMGINDSDYVYRSGELGIFDDSDLE